MSSPDSKSGLSPAHLFTSSPARVRRLIGFVIGLLLLAAAVWAVATQGSAASRAWASVRDASPWLIAAALLLPLVNWLLISLSFWVVMRRYQGKGQQPLTAAALSLSEMARLIGAAWLLNYLPLRPGLLGRIAYHRAVNGIAVGDSIRGTLIGMASGLGAVVVVVLIAAVIPRGSPTWMWAAALGAPAAILVAWAALAAGRERTAYSVQRTSERAAPAASSYVRSTLYAVRSPWLPLTLLLRYADMLVWVLRYAVVFALVGAPIGPGGAAAVTGASQIAMTIPLVGNGLGLREWAVGLTASHLPPEPSAALPTSAGLAADLANRAAELTVAIPVGLLCASSLLRRRPR